VQPRIAEYPFPAGLVGDPRPFTDVRRARREIVVQFLTGTHDFAQLAEEWDRLHAQSPAASVYNSWIWLYRWWQTYGGHRPLRLLVALEGGEAVGMLALYIQTVEVMGRPVRLLRLVGTGGDTHPDDLGPVVVAERENEVAGKLAEAALCIGDVDVLALSDVDPRSRFPSALEEAAADGGHARIVTASERKDPRAAGHRTTLCVRVFRRTRSALAYRLIRIWLPLLKARFLLRPAPKLEVI